MKKLKPLLFIYKNVNRDGYPIPWQDGQIQALIRDLAGHRCEECYMEFEEDSNFAKTATQKDGTPMIGTVHHINGEKQDCRWENLVYLCQRCHLKIEYTWRPGKMIPKRWISNIPQWVTDRNLPYEDHPQLRMFDDL